MKKRDTKLMYIQIQDSDKEICLDILMDKNQIDLSDNEFCISVSMFCLIMAKSSSKLSGTL